MTQARFLFLYDADTEGIEKIRKDVKTAFSSINGESWLDEWQTETDDPARAISADGDKALYVWSEEGGQGTLENILMPVLRASAPELTADAEKWVEELFKRKTDHKDQVRSVAEKAWKHKATITLAGQPEKPGMSMSVILDQTQLLENDVLLR